MRRLTLIKSTIFSMLLLSCSTSPELDDLTPVWNVHGLEDAAVHSIQERNGYLYAGTDEGVYISNNAENSSWGEPELDIEGIQYINLALDTQKKILAAAHYWPDYFDEENPVLFESLDNGKTWDVIKATVDGLTRYGQPVSSFITLKLMETQTNDLSVLFGYNGVISRSSDGGRSWNVVFDEGGFSSFLAISNEHPDHIWTGGTLPIQWPYLATSGDGGENWTVLNEQISSDTPTSAITAAISPRNPEIVLLSSGPAIQKTENGGKTWETVLEDLMIYTIKNGLKSPERVYAAGVNLNSRLSMVVSNTYGEEWSTFVFDNRLGQIQVYDMTVANIDCDEVVFIGTNQGVYSFRLEE